MDARLLLILAAMTACPGERHRAEQAPVVAPVEVKKRVPSLDMTSQPPEGLLLVLARHNRIPAGPPGDRSWDHLNSACRKHLESPCDLSKLVFPTPESIARHLHLSGTVGYVWLLGFHEVDGSMGHQRLTLKVEVAHSNLVQHLRLDPWTGKILETGPIGVVTGGRPIGERFRRTFDPVEEPVAAQWMRLAIDEDEAVEAFRVHVLELQSIGAPADLVRRAVKAGQDEARHRALALAEAGRILGRTVSLGERSVSARPRPERMQILRAVARDGALNEALSMALLLAEAGRLQPHQRELLEGIAADEVRHVALAWDTLHWVWPQLSPSERHELIACCREPLRLASLFNLTPQECEVIDSTVRRRVIEPLLQGLVGWDRVSA